MVVVDSSVLIPLIRIGRLQLLERYFSNIIITKEIEGEIESGKIGFNEIKKALTKWINIESPKSDDARQLSGSESISVADASIILLAEKNKDILLSNDYRLSIVAKGKGIEFWWLTFFILQCLKKGIVKKEEAKI